MVPLNIKVPKPMFISTPMDIRVSNLRKRSPRVQPSKVTKVLRQMAGLKPKPFWTYPRMFVPNDTRLVSLGKPVYASDKCPIIGVAEAITDGDKEAADGSYVEFGAGLQHVTVDLEAEYRIHAICVWHFHRHPQAYYDVIAQISSDPDFIAGVVTVYNNDSDNSAGFGIGQDMHYVESFEGELIDCLSEGSPTGRYVRLYSNGNTANELNHYVEIEVYGEPTH